MSVAVTNHPPRPAHPAPGRAPRTRRVRQEAGDALAVFAFSAAASSVLALAITLVVTLVG
jgi:hypothetical protein